MIFDKPVAKWIVWLSDGSRHVRKWKSLPDEIIAILVCYEPKPYTRVLYGSEYYAKDGHAWGHSDNQRDLSGIIKRGKLIDDDLFEKIRTEVHEYASK
jgi:hypothetical protein